VTERRKATSDAGTPAKLAPSTELRVEVIERTHDCGLKFEQWIDGQTQCCLLGYRNLPPDRRTGVVFSAAASRRWSPAPHCVFQVHPLAQGISRALSKAPKRQVTAKPREDRAPVLRPNDVWAMDFVHDQLATGRRIRVLTVVDIFSRFSPVVEARFSYRAEDVVATLERVCQAVGYPRTIRVDQGSEFVSRDLDLWAYARGVTLDFSRPGKPTDNAFIEAFNGRFRSECLNQHWFLTLADAAEKMEAWLRYYNEDRPHGAIGHKPPIALHNPGGAASPPP
jgi:putative transposase